jgi:DNA modification methylase
MTEKNVSVLNEAHGDNWSIYHADCVSFAEGMPDNSIDLSVYSPPFCGMYNYSSSPMDMSNCESYEDFFVHYGYLIKQIARITKPGRITAVHCMDVPKNGSASIGAYTDFPGDIIRAHEAAGFEFWTRRAIWKEPLAVRLRTMAKGLAHRQICDDATLTTVAGADYILEFRKKGENAVPVTYPTGLHRYAGEKQIPTDVLSWKGFEGDQKKNRFSHFIWRNYASSIWDDIRIDNVLPYVESKDQDDERHVHPLQLDVIERIVVLRSNEGEVVFTPFLGVGSEAYGAVINGRKAIGTELKSSYFNQAIKNLKSAKTHSDQEGLLI